jgi:hypothetical protein
MKRQQQPGPSETGPSIAHPDARPTAARGVPRWDPLRRELLVDGQVVKRFRVPAPNQIAVLAAFEEEGWPPRVFGPLPPKEDQERKQRLRETIRALNHHQRPPMLRFSSDGTGQGILWEWANNRG